MKAPAEFLDIAKRARAVPAGETFVPDPKKPEELKLVFEIDALGLPYGRDALSDAAEAAARAAHHHGRALDAVSREARLRVALEDAIAAIRAIQREANLTPAALAGHEYGAICRAQLDNMSPPPAARTRGSPGRVVHAMAAEAAAQIYARAEGRRIPRSGRVASGHPLQALLRAVGYDLFGRGAQLSVSLLRNSQEIPARAGIPVSRPLRK